MPDDLLALAQDIVSEMNSRAGVEAELFLERRGERRIVRRGGTREDSELRESSGAAVRAFRDGSMGFACASRPDAGVVRALWESAVRQLDSADAAAGRGLPSGSAPAADAELEKTLLDVDRSASWDIAEERLLRAESAAEKAGARAAHSEISLLRRERVVANTRGVVAASAADEAALEISCCAQGASDAQFADAYRGARTLSALDEEGAGREAALRAVDGVNAAVVRHGRRAVVLEPWIMAEFIDVIANLLSAEEVQQGRSLLSARVGRPVASALVTLRDDARRSAGFASASSDDEGVATADKLMIERGILRDYFYDGSTAAHEKRPSNGCAWRANWMRPPSPGPSNFYLAAGGVSRSDVLADTKNGILVTEILGAHMIDPISGAFSVGVSGREILSGKIGSAFKGAMISGNLLELLEKVDAVADDLRFFGAIGSPTARIRELDIA